MTGRMGKGNGRILKMKTSSLNSVVAKRLPEEESAIATVPDVAKAAGSTNTTFAGALGKVISHTQLNR